MQGGQANSNVIWSLREGPFPGFALLSQTAQEQGTAQPCWGICPPTLMKPRPLSKANRQSLPTLQEPLDSPPGTGSTPTASVDQRGMGHCPSSEGRMDKKGQCPLLMPQ